MQGCRRQERAAQVEAPGFLPFLSPNPYTLPEFSRSELALSQDNRILSQKSHTTTMELTVVWDELTNFSIDHCQTVEGMSIILILLWGRSREVPEVCFHQRFPNLVSS